MSTHTFGIRICVLVMMGSVSAQVTQRVSLGRGGAQGHFPGSSSDTSMSADGRYVAFRSEADELVVGDTNGALDVFVRDRQTGRTERISVDSFGAQATGASSGPSLSADGRYVAFESHAGNLVPGDTNGPSARDVFVHDRTSGTTERVSIASDGSQGDGDSFGASISADGRYVAFVSTSANLVSGDTSDYVDVFVHDRSNGTTERVNLDSSGTQANGSSYFRISISADARFVAFSSQASNLVPSDLNSRSDVFVRDRQAGTTELVSQSASGVQGDGASGDNGVTMSADGRYVAFWSQSSNLVTGGTSGWDQIFLRDRQGGTTDFVSVDPNGIEGSGFSYNPSISGDGRFVAFLSWSSNLVPGDTNARTDVFLRDVQAGTTERVSLDSFGGQGNQHSNESGFPLSISADGRYVAFDSSATNLVPGDTNFQMDVFVRDRIGGTDFTSLCEPGTTGVTGCPCSNPPSGPGLGCDNSAATGGARLSAAGGTFLSSDSLVFTTSGETATATSLLLQGTALASSGVVYGQGVRCVAGTLKRLFTKSAVGGSIRAPDFGAGDPTVSSRSAAMGHPIHTGQSRFYFVYYRDPVVLGGCPAASVFNATQAGEVAWSP